MSVEGTPQYKFRSASIWIFLFLFMALALKVDADDVLCRFEDLASASKNPGNWIIPSRCTIIDLSDFMAHEVEMEGKLEPNGVPYTSASLLNALLAALERSWGGSARIVELNLSGCAISNEDVPTLLNILSENTFRAQRDFFENSRRPRGAEANRHTLLSYLHTLRLDNNLLGDSGMESIAAAFGISLAMENLPLKSGNRGIQLPQTMLPVAPAGGAKAPREWLLSNLRQLQRLSLERNNIGVHGISALLKTLQNHDIFPQLEYLDMRLNPVWRDRSYVTYARNEELASPHLWWARMHSVYSQQLTLGTRRSINLASGPHRKALTEPLAASSETNFNIPQRPLVQDGHATLDRRRTLTAIKIALQESQEEIELGKDDVTTTVMDARVSNSVPNDSADTKRVPESPPKGSAFSLAQADEPLHEDYIGNTPMEQQKRRRDDTQMVELLQQCFMGVADAPTVRDLSVRLRRLGHPNPRALLAVDLDDLHGALNNTRPSHIRMLLRCLCEYNFYYEETLAAKRAADSAHHVDELGPNAHNEDIVRQLDEYRARNGLELVNWQTQPRLHADVWGWTSGSSGGVGRSGAASEEESSGDRVGSRISSNSVHAYLRDLDERELQANYIEGGARPGIARPSDDFPQYNMYRQTDLKSTFPKLDMHGNAGLRGDATVRICETPYFRKSHVDLRLQSPDYKKRRSFELNLPVTHPSDLKFLTSWRSESEVDSALGALPAAESENDASLTPHSEL